MARAHKQARLAPSLIKDIRRNRTRGPNVPFPSRTRVSPSRREKGPAAMTFPLAFRFSRRTARRYFPGILVCFTVAAAARFLSDHYGAPQMLFALLLGLAFHFLAEERACIPGLDLTAKRVLQIGVALLGLRITVDQVLGLGAASVGWVAGGVIATLLLGVALAKMFGRTAVFGMLTGGSVGICGASAALAISAVLAAQPERRAQHHLHGDRGDHAEHHQHDPLSDHRHRRWA